MKRRKRSAKALLLILMLVSLAVPANATSTYDDVIESVGSVHLSRNGTTQGSPSCTSQDVTYSWESIMADSASYDSSTQYIGGVNYSALMSAWSTTLHNEVGWAVAQVQTFSQQSPGIGGDPFGDYVRVVFTPTNAARAVFDNNTIYYGAQKQLYLSNTDDADVYTVQIVFDDPAGGASGECVPRIRTVIKEPSSTPSFWENESIATTSTQGGYVVRPLFVNAPIAYPSGYEGELVSTEPPLAKYVGMGDSYSSGQGSRRPYIAGTETATNKCRRSSAAYPMLLAADTSLNLGPTRFVACGGAQASAITTDGFNGESAQMDALTSETELVTMTIIGNDIPFDEFARACATPGFDQGCHLTGQAYLDAMTSIDVNVKPRLEQLLQTLDERLALLDSNARVLVIGYPHLLPEEWVYETGCWWLQPDELPAIRAVQDALNSAIHDKVVAKGGRFEFVSATDGGSPFIGHELCREVSTGSNYFNGVVTGENEADSFHPNEAGQEAYAQLVKDYLILHP